MITTLTLWRYRDIYSYDALLSFRELKVRMTINMELKILNLDWLLEKLFFFSISLSLYNHYVPAYELSAEWISYNIEYYTTLKYLIRKHVMTLGKYIFKSCFIDENHFTI